MNVWSSKSCIKFGKSIQPDSAVKCHVIYEASIEDRMTCTLYAWRACSVEAIHQTAAVQVCSNVDSRTLARLLVVMRDVWEKEKGGGKDQLCPLPVNPGWRHCLIPCTSA